MSEQRTLQDVEKDIQHAEVRIGELLVEQQDLEAALAANADQGALLDAALGGRSIASTAKARKSADRLGEIADMLTALENHSNRLQLERVNLRSVALDEEMKAAGEEVMRLRAVEDQAREERERAELQAGWLREERYSLNEARRTLEARLWESDESYREQAEREREQRLAEHRANKEAQAAETRKRMAAMSGLYFYDTGEELAALQREAEKQGSVIRPISPPRRGQVSDD